MRCGPVQLGYLKVMSNAVRAYVAGKGQGRKKEEGVMMVPVIMVDATLERTRKEAYNEKRNLRHFLRTFYLCLEVRHFGKRLETRHLRQLLKLAVSRSPVVRRANARQRASMMETSQNVRHVLFPSILLVCGFCPHKLGTNLQVPLHVLDLLSST